MNEQKSNGSITISKKTLIIFIVTAVILFAGAIFFAVNRNNLFNNKPTSSDTVNPEIDPDAGDWTGSTPDDNAGAAKGIKIPGYPSITIAANTKNVSMALLNPAENPCYFTFTIVLKDTGEIIYESKQVPPGKVISNVKLTKALAPGEYNATIQINTNSLEDMHAMNGANVETVLIAK